MRVAVRQKQAHSTEFNFAAVFQTIFDHALGSNKSLLADFLVKTAIESTCTLARVFATLNLAQLHQPAAGSDATIMNLRFNIDQETAVGVILILLNDNNSILRKHAMTFAQVYEQAVQSATFDASLIRCFAND